MPTPDRLLIHDNFPCSINMILSFILYKIPDIL